MPSFGASIIMGVNVKHFHFTHIRTKNLRQKFKTFTYKYIYIKKARCRVSLKIKYCGAIFMTKGNYSVEEKRRQCANKLLECCKKNVVKLASSKISANC